MMMKMLDSNVNQNKQETNFTEDPVEFHQQ